MKKTKKISKSQQKLCPTSKNEEEYSMTACGGILAKYEALPKESVINSLTKDTSTLKDEE